MFIAEFRILRIFLPRAFSILLVAFLLILPKNCLALLPSEILVTANRNLPHSSELAHYYMEKRGIPEQNFILIGTTKDERCSREEYDKEIALPIRTYLQIGVIKEQGEGTEKDPNDKFHELAHYYKFESIDLGALSADDIYDVAADPKASDYSGAQLALNAAFNSTYSVLLDRLQEIVTSDGPDVFFDATGLMDELGHQAALLRNAGKVAGSGAMPGPTFDYLSPEQRQP